MSLRPAISSHSLGRAWVHQLDKKLDAAGQCGLDLELFYEDIEYVAKALPGGLSEENLINASHVIQEQCETRGINIICLQPFMHYEGLRDRAKHAARIIEMKLWIRLANILDTSLIGIPSTFLPEAEASGDFDLIVSDLREIADLGIYHDIRFSYEALCWGTHIDTWEQAYEVVKAVDRPNFGLCLDTFNMAGRIYADPEAKSGMTENAEADLGASLDRLKKVDVKKIFCVQVVDAERLAEPITPSHRFYDKSQPSRMSWSRNCRLFYGETDRGAYLPISKILHTLVVNLGFDGPISAELFHSILTNPMPDLPKRIAQRAVVSWSKMLDDLPADTPVGAGSPAEYDFIDY